MKEHQIKQWQYLLEGGDDIEILQGVEKGETYVVFKEEELIGTFTISLSQSEWDVHIFGSDSLNNSLYLHRLAICPSYMGQGLGTRLLEWIQTTYHNEKDWLKLDCVATNKKLVSFYKDNGFEEIGEKDGHTKFKKSLRE
ncbi:GNAT family N-acetyltransferase [Bacillus sp. RD4P76]|uniref:GNAT family N-acetyltransferase n=2 Tax=Bacillus suaedaesalsae TaxID=2810349 RepID=A0ABS2DHU1_9BACI|nr:GNAT family N-acetyltransferase [Bacillus suaedaesalsae]